jgi:hypothetical protein
MNPKRQNIFFSISKISVLLLYIPFFVVQGFFIYNNASQSPSEHYQTTYKKVSLNHQPVTIAHGDKTTDKEPKISLNKRFQPENTPGSISTSFELPVYFTPEKLFCAYTNPHLPSSHLLTKTLRGPPVVA